MEVGYDDDGPRPEYGQVLENCQKNDGSDGEADSPGCSDNRSSKWKDDDHEAVEGEGADEPDGRVLGCVEQEVPRLAEEVVEGGDVNVEPVLDPLGQEAEDEGTIVGQSDCHEVASGGDSTH